MGVAVTKSTAAEQGNPVILADAHSLQVRDTVPKKPRNGILRLDQVFPGVVRIPELATKDVAELLGGWCPGGPVNQKTFHETRQVVVVQYVATRLLAKGNDLVV
jgi:hypothetical protein